MITVQDLTWLEGSWITRERDYKENWRWSAEALLGEGVTLAERDTLFYEQLVITRENNLLTYWATVPGQNNNQPVGFKLANHRADSLVFENPEHDFPNRITYFLSSDTTLWIRVEDLSGEKGFTINLYKQ